MIVSGPALADDVPYAVSPALRPPSNAYVPSLGEIMQIVQLEHIKLWQAGASMNWRLAAFEVDQIRDTFRRTAMFYDGINAIHAIVVDAPLRGMKHAASQGDGHGHEAAYLELTEACNACHKAAGIGFIVIGVPASPSPFADQKF